MGLVPEPSSVGARKFSPPQELPQTDQRSAAGNRGQHLTHPVPPHYMGGPLTRGAYRALCEKLAVLHHREFGKFRRLNGRH